MLNLKKAFVCEQLNGKHRRYKTPDGLYYPSVTTILKKFEGWEKKHILKKWRNKLGDAEADRQMNESANIGTYLHESIENHFHGREVDKENDNYYLFNNIMTLLEHIDEVYAIEYRLFSHKLKMAGSVDLIGRYKGKLSVIDFKNSGRLRNDKLNESYYIQTFFYAIMYYELYGEMPEQLVILVAIRNPSTKTVVQEFVKPLGYIARKAMEIIQQYHESGFLEELNK